MKLEESVKELEAVEGWDLDNQAAVQRAKYLGNGRWEYRNSVIEGIWVPGDDYEFVAMSDLNVVPHQKFSQATTWLDCVDAGIQKYIDCTKKQAQWLLRQVTGRVGGMAASPSFSWCSTPRWRCAEASACAFEGLGNPVAASETSAKSPTGHGPLAHQV